MNGALDAEQQQEGEAGGKEEPHILGPKNGRRRELLFLLCAGNMTKRLLIPQQT